jgi:DNA-binding NarL/FixJ family response regulator
MSDKIRVLVVDDHFFVRAGLTASLSDEPDIVVVAEAGNGRQALELYEQHHPDIVILDQHLPDLSGTQIAAALCKDHPHARIVMLSIDEAEEEIYAAIQAGAQAYLPKATPREELLLALRAVHRGERYLPPVVAERLAARVGRETLTARESEVLRLIVKGLSNKEIGEVLAIAEPTVKLHVRSLLAKLGVSDRTQATTAALRRGLTRL